MCKFELLMCIPYCNTNQVMHNIPTVLSSLLHYAFAIDMRILCISILYTRSILLKFYNWMIEY